MNDVRHKEFTHLKIHTQYSICEGALRTNDLAKYCREKKGIGNFRGKNIDLNIKIRRII